MWEREETGERNTEEGNRRCTAQDNTDKVQVLEGGKKMKGGREISSLTEEGPKERRRNEEEKPLTYTRTCRSSRKRKEVKGEHERND